MDRAYSVLTEKAIEDGSDFVTIRGIASTPTTDRMGDVVEPMGAKFKTPMPLLWQHDRHAPVGTVTFAQPTAKGIPFEARLPRIAEPGRLKDRVDEAIHSMKYGLISAVSIGFKAVAEKVERLKSGGLKFNEWEWLELSLVTIPANSEAAITALKSIDHEHLASAGLGVDAIDPPTAKAVAPRAPVVLTVRRKHTPITIKR
jgi:HK97 family phage prohead protease